MSNFFVDLEGLDTMAAQLTDVMNAVASAHSAVGGYSPQDLGPDGAVWDQLEDFGSVWSNGLRVIHGNINAQIERLQNAGQSYQATDSAIAAAADGGG